MGAVAGASYMVLAANATQAETAAAAQLAAQLAQAWQQTAGCSGSYTSKFSRAANRTPTTSAPACCALAGVVGFSMAGGGT